MLGVFFPLYASYGGANQECISSAVLPTIRTLIDAPPRSPLMDVDIDDVANFMLSLCNPANVSKRTTTLVNMHDSLVFSICSDIIAFPDSSLCKHLVRTLRHLSLTTTNYANLRQILVLSEKMTKRVRERTLLNAVEKFQASITGYLKLAPVKEEEDKPEEPPCDVVESDATLGDMSAINKTADMSRRKRPLYSSSVDNDMLTSEAESDVDTVKKKSNVTFKTEEDDDDDKKDDDDDFEAPVVEETRTSSSCDEKKDSSIAEDDNTASSEFVSCEESLVAMKDGDEELEIRSSVMDDCGSSEDLFASPDLSSKNKNSVEKKTVVMAQKIGVEKCSSGNLRAKTNTTPRSLRDSSTDSEENTPSLPRRRPTRSNQQTPKSRSPPKKAAPSRASAAADETSSFASSGRGVRRNTRGKPVDATSSEGASSPEGRPTSKRLRKGAAPPKTTKSKPESSSVEDSSSQVTSSSSQVTRSSRRSVKDSPQSVIIVVFAWDNWLGNF